MSGYIRSKSKGRRGLSPFAFALLQRIAAWQQQAGHYAKPSDIVPAGARRDWVSLQGLLGRGLIGMCEDGRVRVTQDGWKRLRGNRG